ncbi:MAG: transposase [Planctomycetaceae bacterium]|nr:transposase [Planctomycetaceae bacterium]
MRFVLMKHFYNLDATKNEEEQLQRALDLNRDLYAAYLLKEDFDEFWEQEDEVSASRFLLRWIQTAEASNIPELRCFANTLRNHADQLINYITCEITTGHLEGFNNKIKTMKRQAYDFRDLEFFKPKILALHNARYKLVG